ncbi:hypothetical protein HDU98_011799 [Podochytrium sp. JEL0797]|nr:hypothetical protein HDU98_011799 [Podochytrium sp. JEL0797]
MTSIRSFGLLRRGFSSSAMRSSLYTEHIARVKPSVAAISAEALDTILREDPHRLSGHRDSLHLFDVREPFEWNEERLPYAKYAGRGHLEMIVDNAVANPSDDIMLYCSNGNRSLLSAEMLQQMGFKNVKYLEGGIAAWKDAKIPMNRYMKPSH